MHTNAAAARAVRDFLAALGVPIEDPELQGTPERVAQAFADELLSGYLVDPTALLADTLPTEQRGLVILRGVDYASVCPHHLMPSRGVAVIGYLPERRIVGIGSLVRALEAFSRRLVLQETLGQQLADALVEHLGAQAAAVVLEAEHTCMTVRGERQPRASVVTQSFSGAWRDDLTARAEFVAAFTGIGAR